MTPLRSNLSPGDWAVLGALAEGATHGFAVAQLLGPQGALGIIWTLPKPVVYHTLKKLQGLGLVSAETLETSDSGPKRTIVAVTPSGRRALEGWLHDPVIHVRDARSMLLLKLALLDRSHANRKPLLDAQRQWLVPLIAARRALLVQTSGFDAVLASWRLESAEAVLRFIDSLD